MIYFLSFISGLDPGADPALIQDLGVGLHTAQGAEADPGQDLGHKVELGRTKYCDITHDNLNLVSILFHSSFLKNFF